MREDLKIAAAELAKDGLGFEDILVKLRDRGLTRFAARSAVFGPAQARLMETRDYMRSRQEEVAS